MERWNPEAIPRHQLKFALTNPSYVKSARKVDSCLLCRNPKVNEAGLCDVCWSVLSDSELKLALRWLTGEAP